jgi:5-(carboxyamino)imidazole ribonucleotide synthase
MTALAARPLGFRVHVLDPDPSCAASPVVERVIAAPFDDVGAFEELARSCDVVTLEIEKLGLEALQAAAAIAPVRPSPDALRTVQDRLRQKRWLVAKSFPVGPFREAFDEDSFAAATRAFGGRVFAKSNFGGYDGRGQARLESSSSTTAAWQAVGQAPCVVEEALDLAAELSVLVARGPQGEVAVYPAARNHHEKQVLAWSSLPGDFAPALEREARNLAQSVAHALGVVGLLCVEMFHTKDGRLLVNELAPRPHNSFHASPAACVTGQFEQLVRAVCGLPLGATDIVRPAAIVNLLGDVWSRNGEPAFERALAVPGVSLTLYGKGDPRPGRKMGHLTALGATPHEARARALEAYARLG